MNALEEKAVAALAELEDDLNKRLKAVHSAQSALLKSNPTIKSQSREESTHRTPFVAEKLDHLNLCLDALRRIYAEAGSIIEKGGRISFATASAEKIQLMATSAVYNAAPSVWPSNTPKLIPPPDGTIATAVKRAKKRATTRR